LRFSKAGCVFLLACWGCYGQASQAPATTGELNFFEFMLMNVGSIDHSPAAVAAYETSLVKQFNLSAQESAVIHSAGQTLNVLLTQLRQQTAAITGGKQTLSSANATALAALTAQREELIATLANQILNSVSTATAARLRTSGHIVAAAVPSSPAH
jgi:hypothetical protein